MNRSEVDPGVEFGGQSHQVVGGGEKSLDQHAEQADQDRHLYYHGAQAAHRIDPGFPVHPHGFLGDPGPVAFVLFLNLLHSRLDHGHVPHLVELLQG